jgi:hypothetical protein
LFFFPGFWVAGHGLGVAGHAETLLKPLVLQHFRKNSSCGCSERVWGHTA